MDVKFINPFVHGTVEVMQKIAFMDARPGKVYLKESNVPAGDVSGIIGITGDATGSLAISFTETCICNVVSSMRGDLHTAADKEVFDAVREITKLILAVAGAYIEKEGMKIYAALPTVLYGKSHTIEPMFDSPSIIIPFAMEKGEFVVDICIKATAAEASKAVVKKAAKRHVSDQAIKPTVSEVRPIDENAFSEMDRKAVLMKQLAETKVAREELLKELSEKPFMEMSQRLKFKKMIPAFEAKIKRLKLDIMAMEMLAKISSDELEDPIIVTDYQHYDNNKKR